MNSRLRHSTAEGSRGDVRRKYTLGKLFGSGSFSRVVEGISLETGKAYAIKSTLLARFPKPAMREQLMLETQLMLELDHPHIARTFEFFLNGEPGDRAEEMHIVLEQLTGGDLMSLLERGDAIDERTSARYVLEMLSAIAYCHDAKGVVHRDLKPENFCFASNDDGAPLKLLDFGCSKAWQRGDALMREKVGTWDYMAPEQIPSGGEGGGYGNGVDLWAIGVIAYVLLGKEFPFGWSSDDDAKIQETFTWRTIIPNIKRGTYRPLTPHVDATGKWGAPGDYTPHGEAWRHVSEVAKDFVTRLLVVDPARRMSAKDALRHEWLSDAHAVVLRGLERPAARSELSAMLSFRRRSPMQKAAMHAISLQLSAEELNELRLTFEAIDTDYDGTLSEKEVRNAFKKLGIATDATPRAAGAGSRRGVLSRQGSDDTDSPVSRLFQELGEDQDRKSASWSARSRSRGSGGTTDAFGFPRERGGSGGRLSTRIGWHSFVAAALEQRHLEDADNIASAFNALDVDNTGFISVHDLEQLFGGASEEGGLGHAELQAMLDEADADGSGEIDREEFARMVRSRGRTSSLSSAASPSPSTPRRERASSSSRRSGSTPASLRAQAIADAVAAAPTERAEEAETPRRSSLIPPHKIAELREALLIPDGCVAAISLDR